jgi:hypothetical protein
MTRFRDLVVKIAVAVLGLTPILQAQESTPAGGPQFCPPINEFLTPTLLDVHIFPGISFL